MKKIIPIIGILILVSQLFSFAVFADENDDKYSSEPPVPIITITINGEQYDPDKRVEYVEGSEVTVSLVWNLNTDNYIFSGDSFEYDLGDLLISEKYSAEIPGPIFNSEGKIVGNYWVDDVNKLHVIITDNDFLKDGKRTIQINLRGILSADQRRGEEETDRSFRIGQQEVKTTIKYNKSQVSLNKRVSEQENPILSSDGWYEVNYVIEVSFDGKVSNVVISDIPITSGFKLPTDSSAYSFDFFPESIPIDQRSVVVSSDSSGKVQFAFNGTFYSEELVLIKYKVKISQEEMNSILADSNLLIQNRAEGSFTNNHNESSVIEPDMAEAKVLIPSLYKDGAKTEDNKIAWTITFNSGSLGDLKELLDNFDNIKSLYNVNTFEDLLDKLGLSPLEDDLGSGQRFDSEKAPSFKDIIEKGDWTLNSNGTYSCTYVYYTVIEDPDQVTPFENTVRSSFHEHLIENKGVVGTGSSTAPIKESLGKNEKDETLKWRIQVTLPSETQLKQMTSYSLEDTAWIPYDSGYNQNQDIYDLKQSVVIGSVKINGELPAVFEAMVNPTDSGCRIDFNLNNQNFLKLAGHVITIELETEILNGNGEHATTGFTGNVRYYNKVVQLINEVNSGEDQASYEEKATELITKNVVGNWKSEEQSEVQWYIEITENALDGQGDRLTGFLSDLENGYTLSLTDTVLDHMEYVPGSAYIELSTFDLSTGDFSQEDLPTNLALLNKELSKNLQVTQDESKYNQFNISWSLTPEEKQSILAFPLTHSGKSFTVREGRVETFQGETDPSAWSNAKIRIYYKTRLSNIKYEDLKTEAEGGTLFINTAEGTINGKDTGKGIAAVILNKDNALYKNAVYNKKDLNDMINDPNLDTDFKKYLENYMVNGSGYYNVYFTVDINPQKLIFSNNGDSKITLIDRMSSNLSLFLDSIRLTDMESGDVYDLSNPNSSDVLRLTINEKDNSFEIDLPEGKHFRLDYFTSINPDEVGERPADDLSPGEEPYYEVGNSIELFGYDGERSGWIQWPELPLVPDAFADSGRSVTFFKYSNNAQGGIQGLNGARFKLLTRRYDAESDSLVEITDEENEVHFPDVVWDDKESSPTVNWARLPWDGYVFSLEETVPPAGYSRLESNFYFVFSDYADKDPISVNRIKEILDGEGKELHTIDNGDNILLKNEYSDLKSGNLTVSKTVTGDIPEGTILDDEFEFTVTLSDSSINGFYGKVWFVNGKSSFKLKAGEEKTAIGLPVGITYTVTEKETEGYTITSEGETGTVKLGNGASAKFNNIKGNTPIEDGFGNLTIEKVVSGDAPVDITNEREFTFIITGPDKVKGQTFNNITFDEDCKTRVSFKGPNTLTLYNLPTGKYLVEEAEDSGIVGYELSVDITADGQIILTNGDEKVVTVTNNYIDPNGNLTVEKRLQGNAVDADTKTYRFTITGPTEAAGGEFELADNSETIVFSEDEIPTAQIEITGAGKVTITGLPNGTYSVVEDKDDAQINGYTLVVTGESTVTFNEDSAFDQTITITNSYSTPSDDNPTNPTPEPDPNPQPNPTPQPGPGSGNNPGGDSETPENPDNTDPVESAPKLTIFKEQSVQRNNLENYEQVYDGQRTTSYIEVREGDIVTYYLTVKNVGNATAENVVITDPVPDGLIIIEHSATREENLTIDGNTLTWLIESLPANESLTIEVQFKIQVPEITQEIYWKNTAFVDFKNNPNEPVYSNTVKIGDPPTESNTNSGSVNKTTTTISTNGVTATGVSPQTGVTGSVSLFILIGIVALIVLLSQFYKAKKKQRD